MEGANIMSNSKQVYTKQFKEEAIALWKASEKWASTIEQELGITAGLLSRWRRKQRQQARAGNLIGADEQTVESEAHHIG